MSNDVSVLLGDGSGGFADEVRYAVGNSPTSIAIGYVDDDAYPDLVAANLGSGDVSVLLGDGSGEFGAAQNFSIGEGFQSPYAVALGDANEDGHLDIATANTNISNDSISLLLGDGTGNFAQAGDASARRAGLLQPAGNRVHRRHRRRPRGHRHRESRLEQSFAARGRRHRKLRCSGASRRPTRVRSSWPAADVTGDGNVDLVTVNQTAQSVSVLAGDGNGGFAASANFAIYPPQTRHRLRRMAVGHGDRRRHRRRQARHRHREHAERHDLGVAERRRGRLRNVFQFRHRRASRRGGDRRCRRRRRGGCDHREPRQQQHLGVAQRERTSRTRSSRTASTSFRSSASTALSPQAMVRAPSPACGRGLG